MRTITKLTLGAAAFLATGAVQTSATTPAPTNPTAAYGKLPLAFEANRGQYSSGLDFLARGRGYSLGLTSTEAVFALGPGQAVHMQLIDSNPRAVASAEEPLRGVINHLVGNDPAKWRTHVPTFGRVRYSSVYPGIDLVYYGNQQRLEYDFVVAPGSDPSQVALAFPDAASLRVAEDGDLLLGLDGREMRWQAPVVYQTVNGQRKTVAAAYRLRADARSSRPVAGFRLGPYDAGVPLVIDPVLVYSGYLGGADNDQAYGIAVDSEFNAYVTGDSWSLDFPPVNALQPANAGGLDVFVTKIDPTGTVLVYSTYLGGSAFETGRSIALDGTSNVFVLGDTSSNDFPGAAGLLAGNEDVFVVKLNAAGDTLLYSMLVGGSGNDRGEDIAVDALGRAYGTGSTESVNFPTTAGAYDVAYNGGAVDAFVFRVNAAGTALGYSTFLGGSGYDYGYGVAVSNNEAYVTGRTTSFNFPTTAGAFQTAYAGGNDIFVSRLNNTGAVLQASTFVGDVESESGNDIAIGALGHVFVGGWSSSPNYDTTPGAYDTVHNGGVDGVITKLDGALTSLTYSTFVGGEGYDTVEGIALNSYSGVLATGFTSSPDFPVANPIQAALAGGVYDAFVLRLSPNGATLNFSTYHGGPGYDQGRAIAVDSNGHPYVAGLASDGFPVVAGPSLVSGGLWDAFVTRIGP